MTVRRSWLPFVVMSVVALIALLIAGSRERPVRTFALGAPSQAPVAVLAPGTQVCEGPVVSQGRAQSVRIFGAATGSPALLTVEVRNAPTGHLAAIGVLNAGTVPGAYTGRLASAAPGGEPLDVCLGGGAHAFTLLGSAAIHPNIAISGKAPAVEFSLVLLNDDGQSLLGSLGTAFSRASLFRPGWVGTWTFWALALILLSTIALGALAIASAASADDLDDRRPPGPDLPLDSRQP